MSDRENDIQTLVEEFRSLRVHGENIRHQEDRVLQELRSLLIIGNTVSENQRVTIPASEPPAVAINIPVVVARRVHRARELQGGDRVRITNSITNITRGREATELDRLSTVRRVTPAKRVLLTTDSGVSTWRFSTNLSRVIEDNE